MAIGKVWIDPRVADLYLRLQAKLGGFPPILNVFGAGERPVASASVHQPSLYPELNVPEGEDADWGETARGIAHLISVLDEVPELRVVGNESDALIARDINSALQHLAVLKENVQPKPLWVSGALDDPLQQILHPEANDLPARRRFNLVQLLRLLRDGHPEAAHAVEKVRAVAPRDLEEAEHTVALILKEDLRTAAGKSRAAKALLGYLGLAGDRFFVQQQRFTPGSYENHSLDYYPARERARAEFEALRPEPATRLHFQLPVALPIKEGVYRTPELSVFIRHRRLVDARAGLRPSQDTHVDLMANASGLYARTEVELWMEGELRVDDAQPPGPVQYQNLSSYPTAVREAVARMNRLVAALRAQTGRSDIPDFTPGEINQLAYEHYSPGRITRQGTITLEFVRVVQGALRTEDEIGSKPHIAGLPSFSRELLESAKFQVTTFNLRRAILDLAGSFEAFVAVVVTPQLGDVSIDTRRQFIDRYGRRLSRATLTDIEGLAAAPDEDRPRMPAVAHQLKQFRQRGLKPALNQQHVKRVLRIMAQRNDAAHGRPLDPAVGPDLIRAVEAMDSLLTAAERASAE